MQLMIGIVQFFVLTGLVLLGMAAVGACFQGEIYAREISDFSKAGGLSLLTAVLILFVAICSAEVSKRLSAKTSE